jgi:hypothetical protein
MKCQSCNHVNKDGTKFCESCGTKLETLLKEEFCGSCNKPNPSNFKFCKHCGAAKDGPAIPTPAGANNAKSEPKQSVSKSREELDSQISKPQKKSAPWTLIIVVVVILVGAAYFFIGKSGKNKDVMDASPAQRPANGSQVSGQAGEVTPSSLRSQAMPYIQSMFTAIQSNNQSSLDENIGLINGLIKPASGDRKAARKFNDAGLAALKANNLDLAVSSFKDAVNTDLIDQEATNNLGYAYYLNGDLDRAKGIIEYTLALAPQRTSAWTNYAVILFKQGSSEQAVNAYLIAYKYAKNQDRLIIFLEKQAQEDPDAQLRPFYSQVLTAISQRK